MVKHLPPAIKHLLTQRHPHSLSSPPAHQLNALFARTLKSAEAHKTETGWLVLSTCTLLTMNRPASVAQLYRFVVNERKEPVRSAALMREAALKSTIFVGVPRVILSLAALHEVLGDDVKSSLRRHSLRTATPETVQGILKRGRDLWDSIYAPHAEKLHQKLGAYHPDFIEFIINSYGSVLTLLEGQDVQGNLSRTLGSVVGTACLRAEGGVGPQLTSHVFGLLKARNTEQNEEDKWLSSDEGAEWVIKTVDETMDGVTGSIQAKL